MGGGIIDSTLVLVAAITAIPATLAAIGGWHNGRKIDANRAELNEASRQNLAATAESIRQNVAASSRNLVAIAAVHAQVKPGNGLTLGQSVDALLTHQIEQTKKEDRTDAENNHILDMGEMQPDDQKKRSQESGQ